MHVCRNRVHQLKDDCHLIDWKRCDSCFNCVEICLSNALSVYGELIEFNSVVAEIMKDVAFYIQSGGGVTLSGGEPLMQMDFSCAVLSECKKNGIHTAVESNLAFSWEKIVRVIPLLDLMMADIKHIDDKLHVKGTGMSNITVLENIRKLGQCKLPLILRTPVIPGFNDTPEDVAPIAEYIRDLPNLQYYELLKYHPLGCHKAAMSGMVGHEQVLDNISTEKWEKLIDAAVSTGIQVMADGRKI
jgi:pyruvate formate lyase activating enzyme